MSSALRESLKWAGIATTPGSQARFMGLKVDPVYHKHREVVYHLAASEQDIMGSFWRDTPKKLIKKFKRSSPYFAIFLGFSALPIYTCDYLAHQKVLQHRS